MKWPISSGLLRTAVSSSGGTLLCIQIRRDPEKDEWADLARNGEIDKTPGKCAMKIMSPYTARVCEGKFRFPFDSGGKEFNLNAAWHPHAIHGYHSQLDFFVKSRRPNKVKIYVDSKSFQEKYSYPSHLLFETTYSVSDYSLTVEHQVTNTGENLAPFYGGSHGFFLKHLFGTSESPEIKFKAPFVWDRLSDYPTEPMASGSMSGQEDKDDFSNGMVPEPRYDHTFSGWDGEATATWKNLGLKMIVTDESEIRTPHLHLWYAEGQEVFAPEPVTGPANAANFGDPGTAGVRLLKPGQSSGFKHNYRWEFLT